MSASGFSLGLLNLWLPFTLGYGLIWLAVILSGQGTKRGESAGQPEEYGNKKLMYFFGFYPFIALVIASVFIPIKFGQLFWPGLIVFCFGVTINIITIRFFLGSAAGLKTNGIYQYSRNPMYLANFIYILGLNLLGWDQSWANIIFILLTLYWIIGTHWSVLREEAFLEKKFGQVYLEYKKKTPRYFIIYFLFPVISPVAQL